MENRKIKVGRLTALCGQVPPGDGGQSQSGGTRSRFPHGRAPKTWGSEGEMLFLEPRPVHRPAGGLGQQGNLSVFPVSLSQ